MTAKTPSTSTPPFSTADLYDEHGETAQCCDLQLRDFGAQSWFSGPLVTIKADNDNQLLKAVLAQPHPGHVAVVDAAGSLHAALVGDMLAAIALASGWSGIVLNGAVRDVRALAELPIGVKALGTNARKCNQTGGGEHNVPVHFGGATFTPGHTLYSDQDGIIVNNLAQRPRPALEPNAT